MKQIDFKKFKKAARKLGPLGITHAATIVFKTLKQTDHVNEVSEEEFEQLVMETVILIWEQVKT